MRKLVISIMFICVPFSFVQARDIAVTMNKVSSSGLGDSIGVVVISEVSNGLLLTPYLHGMPSGDYTFSINETVSCHNTVTSTGISVAAMAAGNSLWQLPDLRISLDGSAMGSVSISNIGFDDISQRTLIVSKKTGLTLGFSHTGNRVACGSLEQY